MILDYITFNSGCTEKINILFIAKREIASILRYLFGLYKARGKLVWLCKRAIVVFTGSQLRTTLTQSRRSAISFPADSRNAGTIIITTHACSQPLAIAKMIDYEQRLQTYPLLLSAIGRCHGRYQSYISRPLRYVDPPKELLFLVFVEIAYQTCRYYADTILQDTISPCGEYIA